MSPLSQTPPIDDATRPIPPRYWWLKRILLACGVLIVGLVLLRWWWGWEAERRLQAKIDELRAAGEPTTPEDFELPALPDEKNAAHFYRQAAGAITQPPESRVSVDDIWSELADPAVWAEYGDDISQLMAANAEALRLARHARTLPKANWNAPVGLMAVTGLIPELSARRATGKLLSCAFQYHHHTGGHAEAVEALRDACAHAEAFGQLRGHMVGCLVLQAIEGLTVSTMEHIVPTLMVTDAARAPEPDIAAASRERVEALLTALLDERYLRENWRWAMHGDRVDALQYAQPGTLAAFLGPAVVPPARVSAPAEYVTRPMIKLDILMMLEHYSAMIAVADAATCPQAQTMVPRYPAFDSGIERNVHFLSRLALPTADQTVELFFRMVAQRRLAATALAIRLYELDHGRRPPRLEELVPFYLPGMPVDPFTAEPDPIRYLPDAPRALLYSVGRDGVDDGGAYQIDADGGFGEWPTDELYFLNGDRPREPSYLLARQAAASQAVEDEGEEVSDGGEGNQDQPAADQP
jgi:hypothetical protein